MLIRYIKGTFRDHAIGCCIGIDGTDRFDAVFFQYLTDSHLVHALIPEGNIVAADIALLRNVRIRFRNELTA